MKTTFLVLSAIAATLVLSGCSPKTVSCELLNSKPDGLKAYEHVFYLTGKVSFQSPSAGANVRSRNLHVLQNAAQLTLDQNLRYFAFASGDKDLNNHAGSLMNTAKEYIDTCAPIDPNPFVVGKIYCGWDRKNQAARAIIVAFDVQPSELVTYDAARVKEELMAQELWRTDGIETHEPECK